MIQISKKIGAAARARRSRQASHRFHVAVGKPAVMPYSSGNRRRIPAIGAILIQGYGQPPRQTSTVEVPTASSVDPERYQPMGFIEDDPTITRILHAGRSRDSFSDQPEGTAELYMAMASFDAAISDWNITRRDNVSPRDLLREPDLSGGLTSAVMTPYGLPSADQANALEIGEWIPEPFETPLASPKPELDLAYPFNARPISIIGSGVSSDDTFGLASPNFDVQTWMNLPESVINFQPTTTEDARAYFVGDLTDLTAKDIADPVKPSKAPVDALDIAVQLDTLRTLKSGWADGLQPAQDWRDGYGMAPNHEGLDWLAGQFERFYANSLPRPYLYPTPQGGVQAEWLRDPHDASLEIDLESHSAEWHCLNLVTKASVVEDLNLDLEEAWEWLSTEVKSLGSTTE